MVTAAQKNFRSKGGSFTNFYRSASSVDSVIQEIYSQQTFEIYYTSQSLPAAASLLNPMPQAIDAGMGKIMAAPCSIWGLALRITQKAASNRALASKAGLVHWKAFPSGRLSSFILEMRHEI